MSNIVIKAENISKQYRLGQVGTGTLTHDLNRFWHKIRGKEDPYLKIGEANDRSTKGTSDYVWSLQDINFEINEGDAVGIIGRNGAGKSTLLKLLSRVTKPTTGSIYTKGRIASLLEVGTGFHPEMTGRENIFLNGAILGMTRKEITRKFDEIVDFSGVERYIDTPVKRYSSGMYVRLAFAVAAHLESEILIVDEVLAVGDAEFQKKCLGKMSDVSKGEGRTVLFVSHNMPAVRRLCNKGLMLEQGKIAYKGEINSTIEEYISKNTENTNEYFIKNDKIKIEDESVELLEMSVINQHLEITDNLKITDSIGIRIKYRIKTTSHNPDLSCLLSTIHEDKIFHSVFETRDYSPGIKDYTVWLPKDFLNAQEYLFTLGISSLNPVKIHIDYTIKFKVYDDPYSYSRQNNYLGEYHGFIRPQLQWKNNLYEKN